jgi:hypothetical protein
MLWNCRDCGNELRVDDPVLASAIGWTALDRNTGLCPLCSTSSYPDARHPNGQRTHERSRRPLEISRSMVLRWEESRHDEAVDALAQRLGFTETPCIACQGRGKARCPNCEGCGSVWRKGSTTVSRAILMRLAVLPAA